MKDDNWYEIRSIGLRLGMEVEYLKEQLQNYLELIKRLALTTDMPEGLGVIRKYAIENLYDEGLAKEAISKISEIFLKEGDENETI